MRTASSSFHAPAALLTSLSAARLSVSSLVFSSCACLSCSFRASQWLSRTARSFSAASSRLRLALRSARTASSSFHAAAALLASCFHCSVARFDISVSCWHSAFRTAALVAAFSRSALSSSRRFCASSRRCCARSCCLVIESRSRSICSIRRTAASSPAIALALAMDSSSFCFISARRASSRSASASFSIASRRSRSARSESHMASKRAACACACEHCSRDSASSSSASRWLFSIASSLSLFALALTSELSTLVCRSLSRD